MRRLILALLLLVPTTTLAEAFGPPYLLLFPRSTETFDKLEDAEERWHPFLNAVFFQETVAGAFAVGGIPPGERITLYNIVGEKRLYRKLYRTGAFYDGPTPSGTRRSVVAGRCHTTMLR